MTIFRNMAEHLSSMIGGASLVVLAVPPSKLIEVIILALVGGAIGAFAKGAGTTAWKYAHGKYSDWREARRTRKG
jgi:hypothetical protein